MNWQLAAMGVAEMLALIWDVARKESPPPAVAQALQGALHELREAKHELLEMQSRRARELDANAKKKPL